MTPLQALETIKKALNIEWGNDTCNNDLKPEIDLLTSLITPPTSDEVCEALNTNARLSPKIFFYDEISKTFKEIHLSWNEEIVSYYANGTITINPNYGIPPHIITLIGRFYEAQQ